MTDPKTAADNFLINGKIIDCRPMGYGHINKTFLLTTDKNKYTLQQINSFIFKDVGAVMENIAAVTEHISKKRATIRTVKTRDGGNFYFDGKNYFRILTFMDGKIMEKAGSAHDVYLTGRGFGQFQRDLSDYKGKLNEIIPDFHNTSVRYENFVKSVKNAQSAGFGERLKNAEKLVEEYHKRFRLKDVLIKPLFSGDIPYRVAHNDTKINNIVMDKAGKFPLCVIDLDTVMPGSLLFDFGDAIRTGGTDAPEDSRDWDSVKLNIEYYTAFLEGFCGELKEVITMKEKNLLALSALVMTYECGMRFLGDYLEGDVYFSDIKYPEHNFSRAATQMALLQDMERNFERMTEITDAFFA